MMVLSETFSNFLPAEVSLGERKNAELGFLFVPIGLHSQ
jgi:hypothetical protein